MTFLKPKSREIKHSDSPVSYRSRWLFSIWFCVISALSLSVPLLASADNGSDYFCSKCHPTSTSPGIFPGMPHLAGQHPEYIAHQMRRFLQGSRNAMDQRVNATMAHKANLISRSEWINIATYYSGQECVKPGFANLLPLMNNRCSSCHGEKGVSADPTVPNLAGQSLEYMIAQIKEFKEPFSVSLGNAPRTSLNTLRSHPMMTFQSLSISNDDIEILNYYAKLPCRAQ